MVRFILPVRGWGRGKTRLSLPAQQRQMLTIAMLRDCLAAVLATELGPVVVVSPDPQVRQVAAADGAQAMDHSGGLNVAVAAAVTAGRCAALLPDLPALQPQQLADALTTPGSGFVPDAAGSGTTLLFGEGLRPHFGPGSAARHETAGYPRIEMTACGLTLDVDTWADLLRAQELGLGIHTESWLATSGADDPRQPLT